MQCATDATRLTHTSEIIQYKVKLYYSVPHIIHVFAVINYWYSVPSYAEDKKNILYVHLL